MRRLGTGAEIRFKRGFGAAAVAAVLIFMAGCAWFESDTEAITPLRFGVMNSLPDHACFFPGNGDAAGAIQGLSLKIRVMERVGRYLEDLGYEVLAVENESSLLTGRVDMLLEIVPEGLPGCPAAAGYGFDGGRLSPGHSPRSFVSFYLAMRRQHSPRVIRTNPLVQFSFLPVQGLAPTWDELSGEDKETLDLNLRENMDDALDIHFSRLKI
ncbi:MAG: hypothetical protein HUN04_08930 [Desulfobacter sp.]|nr:MAG: hypothetical protein HUN04_08930 [Desulfobacter sp.]